MTSVLVLGGTGMLGSMLVDVLSHASDLTVTATARDMSAVESFRRCYPMVRWQEFAFRSGTAPRVSLFDGQQWIVNAIGITKPLIKDDNPDQIEMAIQVNSMLPQAIARAALAREARVLQIATDCVYSGAKGAYTEADPHDALDVYGKTKSLGETYEPSVTHLRCSIIGPEPKDFKFLLEWFRRQPEGAQLNGFRNHLWNGLTTLHFAKLCLGIILTHPALPHLQHVLPCGSVTKAEMLHDFTEAFGRQDLVVNDTEAKTVIDRTLATSSPEVNKALWNAAGYPQPPTVREMIRELGTWDYRAGKRVAAA